MKRLPQHGPMVLTAAAVWLLLVASGLAALQRYHLTPGANGEAPRSWPSDSAVPRSPELPTLLVFAHPRCACTRATISELSRLLGDLPSQVRVFVLFFHPHGAPDWWSQTDLWDSAARIPQVRVLRDQDGNEARRFHSETSGRTLLYDRSGSLNFAGGITIARGHAGDSVGREALLALLHGQPPEQRQTPVYGCSFAFGRTPKGACVNPAGEKPCSP